MVHLKKFFLISLILHLSLFLVMVIHSLLIVDQPIVFERAIRVDVIGLPDKIDPKAVVSETEKSPPPAKEKEKQAPQPEEIKISEKKSESPSGPALKSKEKKGPKAGELKTAQLKALDKLQKALEEDEASFERLRRMVFKGNIIADSSSLTGINKLEAEDYVARVEAHVKKNWKIPQWLAKEKLRAKALVRWDGNGTPVLVQLIEKSGNMKFDEIVLETINQSVPLPKPPEKFVTLVKNEGVIFGFPD